MDDEGGACWSSSLISECVSLLLRVLPVAVWAAGQRWADPVAVESWHETGFETGISSLACWRNVFRYSFCTVAAASATVASHQLRLTIPARMTKVRTCACIKLHRRKRHSARTHSPMNGLTYKATVCGPSCSAAVARCISPMWMEALARNSGPRHPSESAWVVAQHD